MASRLEASRSRWDDNVRLGGALPPPRAQRLRRHGLSRKWRVRRPKIAAPGDYDWAVFGPPVSAEAVDARYQRVRVIGGGAFAVVQVARDVVTGNVVAVKKQPAGGEAEFEVASLILLRSEPHPNVLALRGYWTAMRPGGEAPAAGPEELFVYLVFDLMAQTFHDVVRYRGGAFSRREARLIFGAVASGVAHLHRVGILHGDLSARNIFINSLEPLDCRIGDIGAVLARSGQIERLRPHAGELSSAEGDLLTAAAGIRELSLPEGDLLTSAAVRAPEILWAPCAATSRATPPTTTTTRS